MEYLLDEIEHNNRTYWINIEFTNEGFVAFFKEAGEEPVDLKKDFGEKYKEFLNEFKRQWCLNGITVKDGVGSLFFDDKITALKNAKAIIESYNSCYAKLTIGYS